MLRDMVHDVADTADSLQQKWYGATNSQSDDSTRKSRGSVRRLLENCRMFSANRRALSQYELILEGKIYWTYTGQHRNIFIDLKGRPA